MEFEDYLEKRKELTRKIDELEMEYVKSKTKLKIGDVVKFIEKGDYYINEKDTKYKGEICSFEVRANGGISIRCKGIHYYPPIESVRRSRK